MPVSLSALLGDVSPLVIEEKRRFGEDYVEIVAMQNEWPGWSDRLSALLGPARKPAGQKPTKEDERISGPWGGVQKNQVLFLKDIETDQVLALVWPWQDKERFTLKMTRLSRV